MLNYTRHGFRGFPSLICRFGNFRCKSIFVVCVNGENNKQKIQFLQLSADFAHMVPERS